MAKASLRILSIVLLLGFFGAAVRAQSPQYTITDLGPFTPKAINTSSSVAGSMGNQAVLFRDGVLSNITPPGGVIAEALAINDLDQVVGQSFFCDIVDGNCVNGRTRAFILDKGIHTVLGTLGGRDSSARAINNAGQVTGFSDTAGPSPGTSGDTHAFIFKDGVFQDIGSTAPAPRTFGWSINASGQVAGVGSSSSITSNGPFLYSNGTFLFFEPSGSTQDINDSGHIVGHRGGNDDGSGRAYLFSGNTVQDLGTLTAQHKFSMALAINNSGQIVGFSSPSFFSSEGERAFVVSGGVMQDLNNLIPLNSGWVLTRANAINNAGQIVGTGVLNGQPRAFMLTPTEPMLLTEPNSSKAIVLDSVLFMRDPFRLVSPHFLNTDKRTRLTIVARNMDLSSGEIVLPPTAQAEDAQHRLINLPVEFVGKVPGAEWLTQIIVRLPDELGSSGEILVRVSFRGRTSNPATFTILAN